MRRFLSLAVVTALIPCFGGNLLPNSSFEMGTAGWGIMNQVPKIDGKYQALRVFSARDAVHGTSALELRNPDGQHVQLCSPAIPVTPGETYTFSVWLKASEPMTAELCLFSPIDNRWHVVSRKLNITTGWKRCEFTREIPAGHPEVVLLVQFRNKGTLFIDALQFEAGNTASAYAPAAPVEVAAVMPETWVSAGEHEVELRAVNYEKNPVKIPFVLTARNKLTGWKQENPLSLDLPPHGNIVRKLRMPLTNRGPVELGGFWKGGSAMPFRLAVMNALPRGKYDPEQGFCVGVNETGVFRSAGDRYNPYQALEIDFSEHLAMLHATGVSLVRLFEYELTRSWDINPERGKFEFTPMNCYLNAFLKSDLIPFICIDTAFSCDPTSNKPSHIAVRNWFFVRDGKKEKPLPAMRSSIPVSPRMEDWISYISAYVRNCRGRVKYYEIMNEPNLRMSAGKYKAYLEQAYLAAGKADPESRIVGLCSTEDYGLDGGAFIGNAANIGAFRFLDAVSFHPYQAALDSSAVPAARLLNGLKEICRKYRQNVPLWNSELFYIHSIDDAKKYRRTNPLFLRPENLARRYLIDLGEGIRVSTPLHVWQLFEKQSDRMYADPTRFGQKAVPNASAVAQNAFVSFLRGAQPLCHPDLPDGVNGYLYRSADGRETAAVWALENSRKFFLRIPRGTDTFDMFGNPVDCTSKYLLDECPVYLTGKNLKNVLKKHAFQPQEKIGIPGSRFRENGVLAVEFQNRTDKPLALTARLKTGKEIRQLTLPANASRTVHFHTSDPAPEIICFSGEKQFTKALKPHPARKTMLSGETVKAGDSLTFTATAGHNGLTVEFAVQDRKRGERIKNQPWTGDCIELFLDTRPENKLDSHIPGTDVYRLFLAPPSANGLPAELSGSPNLDLTKVKWTLKENGADYSGKIELPWDAIGLENAAELGFDIIADDSEGRKRVACHAWAGNERNFASRFQFGRLLVSKSIAEKK